MWLSGIWVIVWDFIVLPFRFIRETFHWLGEIGEAKSVNVIGDPELPFLNWVVASGRALLTIFAIIGMALAFIFGVLTLAAADSGSEAAIGLLVLVLAPLYVWALVWAFALLLEGAYITARVMGQLSSMVNELKGLRGDLRQGRPPAV